MSEKEINEALKIIKEPITVNSIEYKYFNQENYEKLLSVYENAKWFVSNWGQALQNIKDLQQKVEEKNKEIDRLNNIINELEKDIRERYHKEIDYQSKIMQSDLMQGDYPVSYYYSEQNEKLLTYYLDKLKELKEE